MPPKVGQKLQNSINLDLAIFRIVSVPFIKSRKTVISLVQSSENRERLSLLKELVIFGEVYLNKLPLYPMISFLMFGDIKICILLMSEQATMLKRKALLEAGPLHTIGWFRS